MTIYYQDDWVALHGGDALAVLSSLENGSVDAVVTDPPYSSGGMVRGDRTMSTVSKYVTSGNARRDELVDFSGDGRDQRCEMVPHYQEVAQSRILHALGEHVAPGEQDVLDFGEPA